MNGQREIIKKLRKKAELTRSANYMIYSKKKSLGNWLHFIILLGSSLTAILTFANFDTFLPMFNDLKDAQYKLFIGLLASFVFILTVCEEFLRLREHASIYETTAKQLTTFIRSADTIEKKEIIADEDITILTNQYTMINEASPNIPDAIFFKAKKQLYEKIEISKALEEDPFMSIFIFKCKKKIGKLKRIPNDQ